MKNYRQLTSDDQKIIRQSLINILNVDEKTLIDALWDSRPFFELKKEKKWNSFTYIHMESKWKFTLKSFNNFIKKLEEYHLMDFSK